MPVPDWSHVKRNRGLACLRAGLWFGWSGAGPGDPRRTCHAFNGLAQLCRSLRRTGNDEAALSLAGAQGFGVSDGKRSGQSARQQHITEEMIGSRRPAIGCCG